MVHPGGVRHAIRTRLRVFYEGRLGWQNVSSEVALGRHFAEIGFIFGAIDPFGGSLGHPCGTLCETFLDLY